MKTAGALLLACLVLAVGRPAAADSSGTVRGFFSALDQHDFGGALALTEGHASQVIRGLLDDIEQEAARQHAQIELHVRELNVMPAERDGGVAVRFEIDVVGKKWMFRRVARTLSGTARFYVDEHAPRIVAIVGALER